MRHDILQELQCRDEDQPAATPATLTDAESLTDRGCSCLLVLLAIIGGVFIGSGAFAFVIMAGLPVLVAGLLAPSIGIFILALVCGLAAGGIYIWAQCSSDAMSVVMNCFWAVLVGLSLLTIVGSRLRSAGVKGAVKPSQPSVSRPAQTFGSKPK